MHFNFHIMPQARAAYRGARFLDRQEPGWAAYTDPSTVCIASGTNCVLGQIGHKKYGRSLGYWSMTIRLGLSSLREHRLGFLPFWPGDYLDRAWQREIRARQVYAGLPAAVHTLAA